MDLTHIEQELTSAAALGRDHVTILSAPPGLGKTQAVINLLTQAPTMSAVILCPTRRLAEQTQMQIPCSQLVIDQERCAHAQDVYDLYRRNIKGRKLVCQTCPERSGCPLLSRYRGISTRRVLVSTHEQLRWLFPILVQFPKGTGAERDLVIIDEDPALSLLGPTSYDFDEFLLFAGHLQLILGKLAPEVESLRNHAGNPVDDFTAFPPIRPNFHFTATERHKWSQAIWSKALSSGVIDMIDFVEGAISKGFLVVRRTGVHRIVTPPPTPSMIEHHPSLVILSATPMPDAEYYRMFPSSKVRRASCLATGGELHVKHIPHSNLAKSRRAKNEPTLRSMLTRVVQLEGPHKKYALVTSKTYEQFSRTALSDAGAHAIESFHYGATEGINSAKDADVCIILGVNQRPPEVIIGRYLWELNLTNRLVGADFYETQVDGLSFFDERFETLNQHMINSDVIQGLGRTRWVRRTTPIPVYLLSRKDRGLAGLATSFTVDDDLSQTWVEAQAPGRPNQLDDIISAIIELTLIDRCTTAEVADIVGVAKETVNRHLRDPEIQRRLLENGILMVADRQPGKRGRPGTVLVQRDDWEKTLLIS